MWALALRGSESEWALSFPTGHSAMNWGCHSCAGLWLLVSINLFGSVVGIEWRAFEMPQADPPHVLGREA